MNAREYILSKQTQWALNNNIQLIGSKGKRGRLAYTQKHEDNLFEPLSSDVIANFENSDGNEIHGRPDNPAKMQAIHSSSALGVNIFHYWHTIRQAPVIAAACGFCRKGNEVSRKVVFEEKYPIDDRFQFSPNIDVVFHNKNDSKYKRFAVECKFSESYGSRHHSGLKNEYFKLQPLWKDIPKTFGLAKSISPADHQFNYLHPAQLIKHILGLKKAFGKTGFRLLYLWYDVLGEKGVEHRKGICNRIKVGRFWI